jgi:hypothetical protein
LPCRGSRAPCRRRPVAAAAAAAAVVKGQQMEARLFRVLLQSGICDCLFRCSFLISSGLCLRSGGVHQHSFF